MSFPTVAVVAFAASALVSPLGAQSSCVDRAPLPAYSHNDYDSAAPLNGALRLGYVGVEADLVLVRGALLVAHARREARVGRDFETLYLRPLRELVKRCGTVLPPPRRFLLNVELKEPSRDAYDSLVALLARYPDVVGSALSDDGGERAGRPARGAAVEVVLVGWHPPLAELTRRTTPLTRVQLKLTSLEQRDVASSGLVRIVSLDYGKTIGRNARRADAWLAALRRARDAGPDRLARVYNAPPRTDVYAQLLASGVDLIGTEELERTRAALARLGWGDGNLSLERP